MSEDLTEIIQRYIISLMVITTVHVDDCVITAISWFYETPKQFTGGDLIRTIR